MPGSNYFYYYGFDLYYLILIVPALLLGLWASYQVNHNFKKYSSMMSPISGSSRAGGRANTSLAASTPAE